MTGAWPARSDAPDFGVLIRLNRPGQGHQEVSAFEGMEDETVTNPVFRIKIGDRVGQAAVWWTIGIEP